MTSLAPETEDSFACLIPRVFIWKEVDPAYLFVVAIFTTTNKSGFWIAYWFDCDGIISVSWGWS